MDLKHHERFGRKGEGATAEPSRHGRFHQFRVDISIAISLAPAWLRRSLSDRNNAVVSAGRSEMVDRIATALERRFRMTWKGSDDDDRDALPVDPSTPLFGGPSDGEGSH